MHAQKTKPASTFRSRTGNRLGRAHKPEDKALVRQAFIDAGRHLMALEDPATVSLRRIAAAAGYSPGTIYHYFQDHHALLIAIRELDMNQATDRFEALARGIADPAERVRTLFIDTVNYWLEHLDGFDILFSRPPYRAPLLTSVGVPFGQSPTVLRSLSVYYDAVDAFFESLPRHPLPARLAADSLIAVTHGLIAFPRATRTMKWSDTKKMAQAAVDAMLAAWTAQAQAHSHR